MILPIYSIEYREPLPDEVLRPLVDRLPAEIRQKAGKYKRWQDAHGCLLGKYLLMTALQERGEAGDLNDLQYTDYGRPYLAGGPDFNISHSGNRVVCVVGDRGRVGIDLEEIRNLNISDFKDQFSEKEWTAILQAKKPLEAFYHYWTAKECLSKADGRGLNLSLAGDLKIEDNSEIELDGHLWKIVPLPFFKEYACHITLDEPYNKMKLNELII
jgi:4'-phosphopantetheinyl transferase